MTTAPTTYYLGDLGGFGGYGPNDMCGSEEAWMGGFGPPRPHEGANQHRRYSDSDGSDY